MRDFKKEIYAINKDILILGEIKSGNDKVLCKCKLDGYEWEPRPYDLLKGSGCHQCAGVPRYTTKTFKSRLQDLNPRVKVLGEYTRAHDKIDWECRDCGAKNKSMPYTLLQGSGCNTCSIKRQIKRQSKSHGTFVKEVFALVGDEYDVIGEYFVTDKPIQIKHNKCGNIFKPRPNNFLRGTRCPACNGGMRKKDKSYFSKEVHALHGEEYLFIGEYVNNSTETLFKHTTCNRTFKTTPDSFLNQQTSCPHCHFISKGEKLVKSILLEEGVSFEMEKTFSDLRHKNKLRFDFYLPDLNACIEHDGRHHFESIDHWGGDVELESIQKRDRMKNDYCKENGINLLRLRHDDVNIANKVREYINDNQIS